MKSESISSMSATRFWQTLKSEADAISWNLKDVQRNGSVDAVKIPSLDRAAVSADRITSLITDKMEDFKRRMGQSRPVNRE